MLKSNLTYFEVNSILYYFLHYTYYHTSYWRFTGDFHFFKYFFIFL
nr:MAG TPA: hypothetical protein [Caudoviricetes sp.]